VVLQAEPKYRLTPDDIGRFYVKNRTGDMVPLSALVKTRYVTGPDLVTRFNNYPSIAINGAPAPGKSSGDALNAIREVVEEVLPPSYGYDWAGEAREEVSSGSTSALAFVFGLIFVFLILAALYESWTLPFSVLLSTPVAVFGAFAVLWLRRWLVSLFYPPYMVQIESDIYSQIGLVMLIGLAAKNAILIVEFAKDEYEQGKALVDAALAGARLRLRPILMTSLAFIFGCIPLWTASGAGSVARQIMGTTVIGGMLAASAIGIFFVPAVFYLVERLSRSKTQEASSPVTTPRLAENPSTGDD